MFGGLAGCVVSFFLSFTKQKEHIVGRGNYTSSRFNSTIALIGSAFFWVFYPLTFYDMPFTLLQYPFLTTNAMINAYYCISTTVVTSLALSAVIHGRVRIKDLMYAPFAGAAMIGTSAVLIFNPLVGILLGIISGVVQVIGNLIE